MGTATYLIAIGSNMRTNRGSPKWLINQLTCHPSECWDLPLQGRTHMTPDPSFRWDDELVAASRPITSRPIGPGTRDYANAVVMIESRDQPAAMLQKLKRIERAYGRRPGRRWGNRPLDLDIIAWSGGIWASPALTIPHPEFRKRRFVLAPLCEIAPDWRDPITHLTARHLLARLDQKRARA